MAFIDYYKVLGVEKDATQADIRKAYRKMAKKYHPDINKENPKAQELFQAVNEANEVLSNPEKRKKYDEYGEHWRHADEFEAQRNSYRTQSNPFEGYGATGDWGDFSRSAGNSGGFSDFFEQLFGGAGSRQRRTAPRDIEATLSISLRDAAVTHKETFSINGENIRITIPAGIADGQKIRLRGRGTPDAQGTRGDLYITFAIEPDSTFAREGNNLTLTTTIDVFTLILGGDAKIPTLEGDVLLNIKENTAPDSKLRLKGKGFPVYKSKGERGDLIVTVKAGLPRLNERQKELLREISGRRQ